MTLFANLPHATSTITIDLYDYDEQGHAVWKVSNALDERYIEGDINEDVWLVVDKACKVYQD